jgi:hypothetical protein
MLVLVVKLSVEDSHRKIVPVYPLKVKVPELVELQKEASELIAPPTEPIVKVAAVLQVG